MLRISSSAAKISVRNVGSFMALYKPVRIFLIDINERRLCSDNNLEDDGGGVFNINIDGDRMMSVRCQ